MALPIYEAKNYYWKFDLMAKVTFLINNLEKSLYPGQYCEIDFWKFKFVKHLQMREAASKGEVPDIRPPNTSEQEAALRPMCAQLKVK